MFKPLSAVLGENLGLSGGGLNLDSAQVAASLGFALPDVHQLRAVESDLRIDHEAKKPEPPISILNFAVERLVALKPINDSQREQILAMIAALQEPLQLCDGLVASVEQERVTFFSAKWERCRLAGRETTDKVIPALEVEFARALDFVNQTSAEKVKAQSEHDSARETKLSRFASVSEVEALERKVARFGEARVAAEKKALEAVQLMASVEGKLATARNYVVTLSTEMDRLLSEMEGRAYFDPATGLSSEPRRPGGFPNV